MKKKIMICQPMNGLSFDEVIIKRDEVKKELEEKGYEVVDSIITDEDIKSFTGGNITNYGVFYLGSSILLMSTVDAVYFCKGFTDFKGCMIEHSVADQYGIDKIYE